jgi:chromosome segregation ATPase
VSDITDPAVLRALLAERTAELGEALRRAEFAEDSARLRQERLDQTRRELAEVSREVERLRAELAEANAAYLATVKAAHEGGAMLQRRAERAETRAELAEAATNRWYAANEAAEAERDALKAAVERARAEAERWRDDLKANERESWAVTARHVCAMILAALDAPETPGDAPTAGRVL